MTIITGTDGLLHCTECRGEENLCEWHAEAVDKALNHLLTGLLLVRAEGDLRALMFRSKRRIRDAVDRA